MSEILQAMMDDGPARGRIADVEGLYDYSMNFRVIFEFLKGTLALKNN